MEMIDFVTSEFNYQDARVRWTFLIVGIMDILWWTLCYSNFPQGFASQILVNTDYSC